MRSPYFSAALLAVAVAVVASSAEAQQGSPINAGGWIIAGSGGLSSSTDDASDRTTTSFRLSPTGLYFVQPRLAIGGSLPFSYTSFSTGGHATVFGLGPSLRYYFGEPTGQLFPFISASVLTSWQNSQATSVIAGNRVTNEVTSRLLSLDGSAGITRMLATHVGLTGEAYYTHSSSRAEIGASSLKQEGHDLGLRFGLTVFIY